MELSGYGHLCAGGETFDSVALEEYGSEKYASDLLCANPEYCRRTVFTGGEILYLPVVEVMDNDDDEDESEGESLPETAPWKE